MNGTGAGSLDLASLPAARGVLARAYATDPLMAWVLREVAEPVRGHAVAAWLGLLVEAYARGGVVEVSRRGTGVQGVALWREPGVRVGTAEPGAMPDAGGLLAAFVGADRAARVGAAMSAVRTLAPEGPCAYLNVLAVDPEAQGRGVGTALVRRCVDAAAGVGWGVHLETANERAVTFYERLGFHRTGTVTLDDDGPRLWGLVRPAGS